MFIHFYQMPTRDKPQVAEWLVENIRQLMRQNGITNPNQLAKYSGVSQRHCAYILNDEQIPSLAVIEQFASAFRVSVDELLRKDQEIGSYSSEGLAKVIRAYTHGTPQTQEYMNGIADFESNKDRPDIS